MNIIKNIHSQRGSALLMTILVLSSLMVVGLSAASVALSGVLISGVQQRSTVALYVAESGAEKALYEARKNNWVLPVAASSTNVFGTSTMPNGGFFTVDYASTTDAVTGSSSNAFFSDGDFRETRRRIELAF
jgi:Tfp pilus assembly protein PilX